MSDEHVERCCRCGQPVENPVVGFGWVADPGVLPENLRVRDLAQRTRRPLAEIVFGGQWGTASHLA